MPAPSPVRNTGYVSGTSVSSLTASFTVLPTVGNAIVCCAGTFTNAGAETWTFSDNQTNTYPAALISGQSGVGGTSGNHVGVAIGACLATTTSAGTFSPKVTLSVAHTSGFIAFEASSGLTTDRTTLTQVNGATGPTTVNSSTSSTTTQANELCVACFAADDTSVSAAAGEWTAAAGSTNVGGTSPAPTTTFSFFAAYNTTTSSGVTATVGATNANTGNVEPVAAIATFYASGGGGVTVALTGQAITSAAGTEAPATSVSPAGQAVTGSQGTASPATSVAATGQVATSSQGSLAPASATGVSGQSATGSQGTTAPAIAVTLGGQQISAAQGFLTVAGDVAVALTGQTIASDLGSVSTGSAGAPDYGDKPRRKKAIVKVDGQLLQFRNEKDAIAYLNSLKEPEKPKEQPKRQEQKKVEPIAVVPVAKIEAIAVSRAQERRFDAYLVNQQYEALIRLFEELQEEEEIEELLLLAA